MKGNKKLARRIVTEIEAVLKEKHAGLRDAVRRAVSERRAGEQGRSADVGMWATHTLNDEIHMALLDRRSRQAAEIEAALDRLARGEYGLCRDCETFIGLPRLRVLPFAQRCSGCESHAEIRARANGMRDRLVVSAGDVDHGRQ